MQVFVILQLMLCAGTFRPWWNASPCGGPRPARWMGAPWCSCLRRQSVWSRSSWAGQREKSTSWHAMREETPSAGMCHSVRTHALNELTTGQKWSSGTKVVSWRGHFDIVFLTFCVCIDTWLKGRSWGITLMCWPSWWGFDSTAATQTCWQKHSQNWV